MNQNTVESIVQAGKGAQPASKLRSAYYAVGHTDAANLALLALGFVCLVFLVSPVRAFPIGDDWIYAQSVRDLLNLAYKPHDWSQAFALGSVVWGGLFSLIFGLSFTTLSISTLVLSFGCALAFYVLLRHLNIAPAPALLSTVLLTCNPVYIFLSYAFTTDLPFLAYCLAAGVFYVRAFQGEGEHWLWLGSIFAALACLTRQFGLLMVAATFLYILVCEGLRWRKLAAAALIPAAAFIVYSLWFASQPAPLVAHSQDMQAFRDFAAQHPVDFTLDLAVTFAWMLVTLGLYLLPLLRLPRRAIWLAPVFIALSLLSILSLHSYGTMFPRNGNILDTGGFNMGTYSAQALWDQWAWVVLGFVSIGAISVFSGAVFERGFAWLKGLRRSTWRAQFNNPVLFLYLFALMLFLSLFALGGTLYDRYILPSFAVALIASSRLLAADNDKQRVQGQDKPSMWRWLIAAPLALLALFGQRDYLEHAGVRWQAAEQFVKSGVSADKIDAGFEWSGWNSFEEGAVYVRQHNMTGSVPFPPTLVTDPQYKISDEPIDGYTELGALPYRSWLDGGRVHMVLLLGR